MDWAAAVGALLGIALLLLKTYLAKAPQREEAARNAEIQQGREDIANGDADAVSARVDRLLSDEEAGHSARLGGDQDTARRLEDITGL